MEIQSKFLRYHYEVGFPDYVGPACLRFFNGIETIDVTHRGANQLDSGRYGKIPMPELADILDPTNTLVEVYETIGESGKPTRELQKIVIRLHQLSQKYDYTYVVARDGFIISAWMNMKTDIHRLKTRKLYDIPETQI